MKESIINLGIGDNGFLSGLAVPKEYTEPREPKKIYGYTIRVAIFSTWEEKSQPLD